MAILITYEANKGVDVVYTVATSQAEADTAVADLEKVGMVAKVERLAQASLFFWWRVLGQNAPNFYYTTGPTLLSIDILHKDKKILHPETVQCDEKKFRHSALK